MSGQQASIRSHDLDLALETLNAMRAELGPRARLPKEQSVPAGGER